MKCMRLRGLGLAFLIGCLITMAVVRLQAYDLDVILSRGSSEGSIALNFSADTNMYYQFWGSTSMVTGQWDMVRGISLGEDGRQCWEDKRVLLDYDMMFYLIKPVALVAPDDLDADGIDDVYELYHPYLNPLFRGDARRDFDQDGADNLTEYQYATDLMNGDTDGDTMPDVWEIEYHYSVEGPALRRNGFMEDGLDPLDGSDDMEDPDGDGFGNIYEYVHGTNPQDGDSRPTATIYVAPGATGGNGSQGAPYGKIQDALNLAASYGIIELADGVYSGEGNRGLNYLGKSVMIMSTGGVGRCVINCERRDRGFVFYSGETIRSVLCGVSIVNGYSYSGNGGGIFCFNASPFIQRCVISRCDAVCGGGISCAYAAPFIYHSVIKGNTVFTYGGGIFAEQSSCPRIQNSTLIDNGTPHNGGGIYATVLSAPLVRNSIVWGNSPDALAGENVQVEYCCVEGGITGTGNFSLNPQLTEGIGRLTTASPCIDAGIDTNMLSMDIDFETVFDDAGHANVVSAVDVGADEFIDTDSDGMADSWEFLYFGNLTHSGSADGDIGGADGLTDLEEYLQNSDPTVRDTDGDGLLDGDEVDNYLTSPILTDTDQDYMPDNWEITYGLDPLVVDVEEASADPDEDGYVNVYEGYYNTLPDDAASFPASTLFVRPSVNNGSGSVDDPFNTIAAAIEASRTLDIIELAEGTYSGTGNFNLDLRGKMIMLTGTNGGICRIDGTGSNYRAFNLSRGEDRRSVIRNITIQNFMPSRSYVGYYGGGVLCSNSSPGFAGCTFLNNSNNSGSAVASIFSSPRLLNCVFKGNQAQTYGTLYFRGVDAAVVDGCVISSSNNNDYGIYIQSSTNMILRNTKVSDNERGIYSRYSSSRFENCLVISNSVCGMELYYATTDVHQCTIVDNQCGIFANYRGDASVQNSILWNNQMACSNRFVVDVSYSCVEGGFAGTGNIAADPQLSAITYRLLASSPCIDAGANTTLSDMDGEARWDDPAHANAVGIADIGMDEFVDTDHDTLGDAWEIRYFGDLSAVASTDNDSNGGADGMTAIQEYRYGTDPSRADTDGDGLNDYQEVFIDHTHPLYPDSDADGLNDGWEVNNGLNPLSELDAMDDADGDRYPNYYEFINGTDPQTNASCPTADIYVNALTGNDSNSGTQAFPVKSISAAINLAQENSIILVADGIYRGADNRNMQGNGMRSLILSEHGPASCVIDCENIDQAFEFRYRETDKTALSGLTIKNGMTTGYGGALYALYAPISIIDCVIVSNRASDGGAVTLTGCDSIIRNCQLQHNTATDDGGAIWASGNVRLLNCVVSDNQADCGGALFCNSAVPTIKNSTLVNNIATNKGGGIYGYYASPEVENSILWGNTGAQIFTTNNSATPPGVTHSCIEGGYPGTGNISSDPLLTGYSYMLRQGSPCIDAGVDNGLVQDRSGRDRYDCSGVANTYSIYDIGAYEFVDSDNDGLPDWWEIQFFGNLSHTASQDSDAMGGADGLTNLQEYQYDCDPTKADTDSDGLNDYEELFVYFTHPGKADTDDDFTGDGWELTYGFDPLDAYDGSVDHDGDRFDNIYEFHYSTNPTNALDKPSATVFVDATATGTGAGTVGSPYLSIQVAISNAADYDIIQLADGVYPGRVDVEINLIGKPVMVMSENGPDACVVDIENRGYGFLMEQDEDWRTVVCGLTIRNASGFYGGAFRLSGMVCPQIRNCCMENNAATMYGAAVYVNRGEPIVRNCVMRQNTAYRGGAIFLDGWYGMAPPQALFENNRIMDNEQESDGTVCIEMGHPQFVNNTIVNNRMTSVATNTYAGVYCKDNVFAAFINCIIWNNGSVEVRTTNNAVADVQYSCVRGGHAGTGNIASDPQVIPFTGRLQATSPCVDAGKAVSVTCDFEHEPRWDDPSVANAVSAFDIGADEFVDTDNDNLADIWETALLGSLVQGASSDGDSDTLNNLQEYIHATDPDNSDTDNDALNDAYEISTSATLPYCVDTDGDDVGDGWEIQYGFNALDPSDGMLDPDLDRYPNLYEYKHGSVPTNRASIPVATVFVDASSMGGNGSQSSPYRCISTAINSYSAFDIIEVAAGTYLSETGYHYFYNPALLIGKDGAAHTIVDSQDRELSLNFRNESDLKSAICGMTFANVSNYYGTCISVSQSGLLIDGCCFEEIQSLFASVVDGTQSKVIIRNSRFVSNFSWVSAAVHLSSCLNACIENCVLAGNLTYSGETVDLSYCEDSSIVNCTIVNNFGKGVNVSRGEGCSISNSIVWNLGITEIYVTNTTFSVDYCCVEGGATGTGNISSTPYLTANTYRLKHNSPCIDSGGVGLVTDVDGEQAWDDPGHANGVTARDIGADEFVDTDSDHMGDAWEIEYFGGLSHDGSVDSDADGHTNLEEYENGSDPTQA